MRKSRQVGCRRCGSRQHITKSHDGRLVRTAFLEVTVRRDPLGIARSSWVVNQRRRPPREAA
jgi:hypothetical protein